ncbi:transferrin-binding protein-like solute binding protein [Hoeflea alexandrii]|uniref:transferrin-binding protein-like solute binding protein n=1 Tax=Hoeflea alexandrii TaxID=288436 RepID=UPI0022AE626F|nr:transferrin-binding protein-like solute binding protein [Hoeflea alexandrii]MCZ4290405.1 transferrin-binding protein-like solute binding protein [Hoeflea alexandrii]
MTRKTFITGAMVLAALPGISGCTSSSSAPTGAVATPVAVSNNTLPIKTSGKALAFRASSNNTSSTNSYTNLPSSSHQITQASILERSAAGGINLNGSADMDPNPNANQGTNPALVSASTADTLQGGTAINGMKDVKGNVYFENGNFGDAQASNESTNLSSVGVYNVYDNNTFVEQIVMKHGTTIRYQEGTAGDGSAIYAVGYIGNNTTNMPTSGQATYKGFHEGGTSVYNDNGTMQSMGLSGGTVELTADFAAGTVTGGISGAELAAYKNGNKVVLNPNATGLNINANITGSEYTGTAQLVDASNNPVGTAVYNEAIGAFFGDAAAETAAAYVIEGNAQLDGANRDYIMSGALGGVKK